MKMDYNRMHLWFLKFCKLPDLDYMWSLEPRDGDQSAHKSRSLTANKTPRTEVNIIEF